MPYLSFSPIEGHLFHDERKLEVEEYIYGTLFERIRDNEEKILTRDKKVIAYDTSEEVILFFPKISSSVLSLGCDNVTDEFSEEFSHLTPCYTFPERNLNTYLHEFLETTAEEEEYMLIDDYSLEHTQDIEDQIVTREEEIVPRSRLEQDSTLKMRSEQSYHDFKFNKKLEIVSRLSSVNKITSRHDGMFSQLVFENLVDTCVLCNSTWWAFNNGKWTTAGGKSFVWAVVTESIPAFLSAQKGCEEAVQHMGSYSTRNRIFLDASMKLCDDEFEAKLDSNPMLIGMKEGVYDMHKKIVRPSYPADYVSLSTRQELGEDCERLIQILREVFPRDDVYRFFIRSCASMLEGRNKYKVFYLWWGQGNNGKSMIQDLIARALGDYCITLSTSAVTGKRSSSSQASPDMAFAKNKLAVFIQEPNPEEKIQIGMFKELTGNDTMYVRELYKSPTQMKFKAKIVLVANNVLEAPGMDKAFRSRLVVVPFETSFVQKIDRDNQLKMDRDVNDEILKYSKHFLRLILDEYQSFEERGLEIPPYVQEVTDSYLTKNNYPLRFIRERLAHDEEFEEKLDTLYNEFNTWHQVVCSSRKPPTIIAFESELRSEGFYHEDGTIPSCRYL